MPDSYVTQIQEFVNNSARKIPEFMKYISLIFTRILDKLVNGFMVKETIFSGVNNETTTTQHKYYRYFISILLIFILFLFHYLNTKQNLFSIKNTKYEALLEIMLIAFSIYFFLFFVYRNNTSWDTPNSSSDNSKYNSDSQYTNVYSSRALISRDTITNKETLNKDVLKKSVTTPLFNIMKYIFYLLLIILIPLFVISYALYSHKVDDTNYNITRTAIIIIIILIMLSIIAVIFSIKTPSSTIYCEIKKPPDGKPPSYTNLITAYVKYFACIFKNLIFFIPCLIAIFVSELNKDIQLTPSPVYILFFILLLLVTLLFFLPLLFNYIRTFNKSDILQGTGPFYLNKERTLGKYQNLNTNLSKNIELPNTVPEEKANPSEDKIDKMLSAFSVDKAQLNSLSPKANDIVKTNESLTKTFSAVYNKGNSVVNSGAKDNSNNDPNIKGYTYTLFKDKDSTYNIKTEYYNSVVSKEKFPYSYTYSLSFYLYLNTQPENTSLAYTKDTILFNYAYKPVIYYNGKSQKIIVKSRTISNRGDQLDTIYEMANPKFQKWLFFVINYDNNIIDVFVDGKLVGSKENVSPYFKGDNITIGENDGIHGSIKQIYYYDKIKTPSTIELLYNLSKNNTRE